MRVITVRQPWAWLIIHGGKDIETRDWPTSVRGRVAIHTSARLLVDECKDVAATLHWMGREQLHLGKGDLALGSIIGTVDVIDCVRQSDSPWGALPDGSRCRSSPQA